MKTTNSFNAGALAAIAKKPVECRVGAKVIANGYPGTVTRVCEWSKGTEPLVEVRLNSGTICVGWASVTPTGAHNV